MQAFLDNVMRGASAESELSVLMRVLDAHAIVSVADAAGNIIYVNQKFCDISGYPCGELIGQNHRVIRSGYHDAAFYERLWQTISAGETWQGEICNRRKDGGDYWVESTIMPVLDADGLPVRYISIRTDITAIKRNEQRAREAEARLREKQGELLSITARLQQSEERLRRSQVFANIGTWDWNIQTGELYWSERIAPLFGYATGMLETTYENFLNAVHPDDRQAVIDAVNGCVEGRAQYEIEHRVVWPDGAVRWVLERGDVIRSAQGAPMHMLGVVQDITDRKQAELDLRQSERRLAEAQRIARLGNWIWNAAENALWWSDEVYAVFGRNKHEFHPDLKSFYACILPADLEKVHQAEAEGMRLGVYDVTHRIVRGDGEVRHVRERAEVIKDEEGNPLRMVGTVQDVTEITELEQRLDAKRRLLELIRTALTRAVTAQSFRDVSEFLLNGIVDLTDSAFGLLGEVLLDPDGHRYLRAYGISNIAWGETSRRFYEEHRESGMEFRNLDTLFGHTLKTGDLVISNAPASDPRSGGLPEGHPALTAFLGVPVFYGAEMVGMFALANRAEGYSAEDVELLGPFMASFGAMIYAKRIAEAEAESRALIDGARREAEAASRAKSEFLSSMSHELRTPLNAILGFAQLLMLDRDTLSMEQLDNANEILRAGRHLLELINEVLDLAKIEAGRIDLSLEPVAVCEIYDECRRLLLPLAQQNDVTVECTCGADGFWVMGDRIRTKQVLLNLMTNAVKYNRRGGRVSVSCRSVDNGVVRVEVHDSGFGIAADQLAELFLPFHRLGAERGNIEGTGIGLALAKRIVEQMGGEIGVESAVGEGSRFWFDLPSAHVSEAFPGMADDELPAEITASVARKLLYVEDNPVNLRLVKQILARYPSIELLGAHSARLGLDLAQAHVPDLILLDINLPDISGIELCERLREIPTLAEVPVVAVSAAAMPSDIERARAHGFVEYLTKPIDVARFMQLIEALLFAPTGEDR